MSLAVLGAVCLAVTGAEALYADLGHFGRGPIRVAWLGFVFPALVINYFGQGALVLSDPTAVEHPLFRLVPEWALLPMVVLATLATIIASQAVITGAFSLTRQAIQLGLLPRLEIRFTSESHQGQIYLPRVNMPAARRRDRARPGLRVLEQPRARLRHLGVRRDGGRRAPGHHRDLEGLALVARG